jgi:Protein of unknown function (DUF3224)
MARKGTGTRKQAKGTYGIKSWDEKTWDGKDRKEQPGAKLTHAVVTFTFQGDIEGEGHVHYLMAYRDDTFATFLGLQQITGRVGDRAGSFVMQVDGKFENGAATSTWMVIPGSGTGELRGIRGEGTTVARHGDQQPFTLDYDFE